MKGGKPLQKDGSQVCVIGLWHLGCVTAACLADLGYRVTGVDGDRKRIDDLKAGKPPVFEPGLAELVRANLDSGRLDFTTDLASGMKNAGFIYITYDTPVDDNDDVDLSEILAVAAEMAKSLEKDSVIMVSSQVPVGTCERLKAIVRKNNPAADVDIAYVPENLRLGQAIQRFKHPDGIVIGADNPATLKKVAKFFNVIKAPKVTMNLRSAEMTKHAINAFLATSIRFACATGSGPTPLKWPRRCAWIKGLAAVCR
jgi:UDPglucose 6-dehydrogenase